jgi:hypothetical protein
VKAAYLLPSWLRRALASAYTAALNLAADVRGARDVAALAAGMTGRREPAQRPEPIDDAAVETLATLLTDTLPDGRARDRSNGSAFDGMLPEFQRTARAHREAVRDALRVALRAQGRPS